MDNTAATMAIRIDAEVSNAVTGLKKVEKQLDSLVPGGQAVANVFQRIQFGMLQIVQGTVRNSLVGITSAMKGMVTSGIKVAETLESAAVGFETVLRSGEDVNALLLDIQKNAVKTPFDVDALTLSTQKMALITKNGAQAERMILNMGKALAAAGRGTAELNRMATNLQQIGTNAFVSARDIREFGNAGIDINRIVSEFSETFKQTGKDATEVTDWLKEVDDPFSVIVNAINAAGESTEGFADVYEKGAQTIKQANENMHDSVAIFSYRVLEQAKVLDKVKNVFGELQNNLFLDNTFTANTIEAIRHLVEMIDELDFIRPIIEGIKKAVSAFATGQFDNVIVFFRELFNAIKQFSGIQVITNAFKVLLDLFSDNHTAEEVRNVANQIGTLVRYFLELKFALSVTNYLANFAGIMIKVGMSVAQAIPSILNFVQGLGTMSASGLKFVLVAGLIIGAIMLIQNFGDQIGEVFKNIGQFFANLGSAIGNVINDFVSFGHNIMVGLWNGIAEGAKAVFEQVKNIAIGIKNIFKSIFRIASPSKVMRDEIGRYIDEGIAEGITAYYGDIASASEEVLSKLVDMQGEYVKELGDFGALDLVQTVKVYKEFASLYAKGTKARWEMDQKVHDSETAIIKEMISLIDDYNKAWDKAFQKAKDYYDMFEYTQATLTRSTKSVIEGLTRQNDNLTKYYNNIAKMSKMGFDADFMTYIYDQGLDAASEVAGLADATAEEIEEINNLWATRGKVAADIATLNTKQLKEDTLEELDYLQSGLETKVLDYYDTGTYLDYNFTRGIYDMMPTIADAVESVKMTASGAKGAADTVKDSVDGLADAIAGLSEEEMTPDLQKLQIEAFDTANAFDLLKNMLAGIPWQVWAVAVGILAYKIWDMFQNIQRDVPKAIHGISTGMGTLIQTLREGIDTMVQSMETMLDALETKIGKVSSATYNSAREISNYESVYRQSMDGILAVTDDGTSDIISMIDFAKSQGVVKTSDATKAIGDIMVNGVENISDDTRRSLNQIEDAFGVTITNSEHVVEKGLQTIDYKARDIYDQVLYDATHKTEDMANNIVGTLDYSTQLAGTSIVGNMSDALNTTDRDFKVAVKKFTQDFESVDDIVADVMADAVATTELSAQKIENAFGKATQHTIDYVDDFEVDYKQATKSITNTSNDIIKSSEQVSRSTSKSFSSLSSKVRSGANTIQGAMSGISGMLAGVSPQLSGAFDKIRSVVDKGTQMLNNDAVRGAEGIFDNLKNKLGRGKTVLKDGVEGIGNTTKKSIFDLGKKTKDNINNIGTQLKGGVQNVGKDVQAEVKTSGDGIINETGGIKNKFLAKIASFVADLGQTLSSVVSSVIKIITDIVGNIVDYIMQIIAKITGGIGKAIQALLEPISDPKLLIGAAALVAVGAAIWVLAKALQEFEKVKIDVFIGAAVALVVVTAALYGLSMIAAEILIGAIALVAISATLAIFGGAMLVLALALEEASKHAAKIDVGALMTIPAALIAIGAGMIGGLFGSIIGMIAALPAMAFVGQLLIIATGLAEITKQAQQIDTNNFSKIGDAISELHKIDFGNMFANIGASLAAAPLAGVVSSLRVIVSGVLDICQDMNRLDDVDQGKIESQVEIVKNVVQKIQGMLSGNFFLAIGQNWQSSQLEGVVTSVKNMMDSLYEALKQLKRIEKMVGKDEVINQVEKVKSIVQILQDMLSGNFFLAIGQNWQSGNLASMAKNLEDMLGHVIGMVKNFQEATDAIPEGSTINDYMDKIKTVVGKIDEVFNGDWLGSLGDSWQAGNLESTSRSLDEILGHVKGMCDKLKEFSAQALSPDDVASKVGDVQTIVWKVAEIGFSQSAGELKGVSEKATAMDEFARTFDSILGTVQSMCNKLKELKDQDYTIDAVKENVANVEKIVWRLAEIQFSQSEGDLSSVAEKANSLREMSSNFDTILGTVQSMVNKLKELRDGGYTVGGGGDKDVLVLIANVEDIVDQIAQINIETDTDLGEMAEKTTSIKTMAENLNGIIEATTKMIENLKAFNEAYQGTTVGEQVKHINDDILKPLMDDPGIVIPYSDIEQEDVDKLGIVKAAIDKINEIAASLKTVEDLSQQILNAEAIVNFIKETMSQIPEAIATFNEDFKNQGIAMANAFLDGWKSVLPDGKAAAHDMQDAMWTEIQGKMQDEFLQGEALANEIVNGVKNKINDMKDAGHKLQDALWTEIQSKFGDEYKQGAALSGQIIDGIWSQQSGWWWTGDNIVAGVAGGINRNMWQINNAAGNISQTAITRLKQLLDIHSPSRVMASLGKNVSEGFADGIIDNLTAVEEAGEALAEAVMDSYNDTIEPINLTAFEARNAAGINGAVVGGSSRTTSVVQNNNIYNGMDMAEALSDIAWAVSRS